MFKQRYLHLLFLFIAITTAGCSTVVEPVRLPGLSPDEDLQEKFKLEVTALTFKEAKALNSQTYERLVSRPGNAYSADVVLESTIAASMFPPITEKVSYKLGVGDQVTLIQHTEPSTSLAPIDGKFDLQGLIGQENFGTSISSSNTSKIINPSLITTSGRITNDGSLLLIGLGRIDAAGREISTLRDEVRGILIRNGKVPNFQLEISEFNSQKAYLTRDGSTQVNTGAGVINLTDEGITLREGIADAGISFNENVLTLIRLQRSGKTFEFTLSDLFSENAPAIYLQDKDHVFIKNYKYVPGKVFLVGGVQPVIMPINPEQRQTLAEVLFTVQGPMAIPTAQRSAIYLLRGRNPVKAYHLDAQNPARILVADAVELRPDDIVFVGEQPINTFNRVLATIFPLRILARDYQNDNLP